MTLDAGTLRHRVDIQRPLRTQNVTTGEVTTSWQSISAKPIAAAVDPLSARELIAAQAVQSQVVARIVIRWRPDLDASMRIVHRGLIYDIAGVLPDKDSGLEYITLPVSQGVNDG
jgi:SPP1 family predicted phage head-tail adaptor